MEMTKKPFARATAFITAIAIAFMTLMIFPADTALVSAEGSGIDYDAAVDYDPSKISITALSLKINDATPTAETEIKDGDDISFLFTWSIPNGVDCSKPFKINLADHIVGIDLGNKTFLDPNGTRHEIKDGYLYVLVSPSLAQDNRKGGCLLEGEADVSGLDDDDDGKVTIKYFGNTIELPLAPPPPPPPVIDPTLSVYKQNVGNVRYDAEADKYYQDYSFTVQSVNGDSTNVVVTDIPPAIIGDGGFSNVLVDGTAFVPVKNGDNYEFNLGTIADGEKKTITYSMEVSKEHLKSDNWGNKKNVISAVSTEMPTPVTSEAYAQYTNPQATKNGTYDPESGIITWKLVFSANVLSNETISFNVNDVLGNGFENGAIESLPGAVLAADGKSFTVPSSAFTDKGNGIYELTYQSKVSEETKNSPTDVNATNTATFDKYINSPVTGSVTIPANEKDFVDKTLVNGDPSTGANWEISIDIPDNPALTKVNVYDKLTKEQDWEANTQAKYDYNSFVITGLDENGVSKEYTLAEIRTSDGWTDPTQFSIDLTSDFVENNKGKTVKFRYATIPSGDSSITYCRNSVKVTLYFGSSNVSDSDADIFKRDMTKECLGGTGLNGKFKYGYSDNLRHPLAWLVKPYYGGYVAGDIITVTDTLPEGYELVTESVALCDNTAVTPGTTTDWGNHWFADRFRSAISVTETDGVVVIKITVSEEMASALNCPGTFIDLGYITQMSEEGYAKIYKNCNPADAEQDGKIKLEFTNNASAKVNNANLGAASATGTVYIDPDKPIDKDVSTRSQNGYFYADYVVKINSDAIVLNGGNDFTVVDKMGTNLEVVDDPAIVITPSTGVSWELSADKRSITFNLKDATAYTITYTAKIKQLNLNDPLTPSTDPEKFFGMFGNTVSYETDAEFTNNDRKVTISDNYRSDSWSEGDEKYTSISLSGTKLWKDSKTFKDGSDRGVRPAKITIVLDVKKMSAGVEVPADDLVFEIDVPLSENMSWSYTIDNLKTLETDGTTYSYSVKEVDIDGYKAQYDSGSGNVDTSPTNISVDQSKYTFTGTDKSLVTKVGSIGYGTLTVTTTENTDVNFDIKVKAVAGSLNYVYDKTKYTRSDDKKTFTFENVPLYIYDANDDAVKLEYFVSEKQFDLNITNTFEAAEKEVGKLVITKIWEDDNDTANRPEIGFTLTGSNGKVYDKDTFILDAEGNSTGVRHFSKSGDTYTFDKLPIYTYSRDNNGKLVRTPIQYYITETTSAADADKLAEYVQTGTGENNKFDLTAGSAGVAQNTVTEKDVMNSKFSVIIAKIDEEGSALSGAKLQILKGTDVIHEWTTDGTNKTFDLAAGTYTLHEVTPPAGYLSADDITFTVAADGTVTSVALNAQGVIEMTDVAQEREVTIAKVDEEGSALSGAKLQILKGTDVIHEWTTDGTNKTFDLAAGTYTLHEVTPPAGYLLADDITFTVAADGTVTSAALNAQGVIEMTDKAREYDVKVSKVDEEGSALSGAKLQILKGTDVIHEWTTDGTVHEVKLPFGTYTLCEADAPSGYELAENVVFNVAKNGDITDANGNPMTMPIVMKDLYSEHEISIEKRAVTGTGEMLAGAKLELITLSGTVIESWTSDTVAKKVNVKPGSYKLVETEAPDGYKKAEAIIFEVGVDGTVTVGNTNTGNIVTMVDKAEDGTVSIRKTDENDILIDGARMKLTKVGDASFVREWTTDADSPYSILLEAGTYLLEETNAPAGYELADPVTFEVDATANVTIGGNDTDGTVTMQDAFIKYDVIVSKTDDSTPAVAVKDAELAIINKTTGSEVCSWTTDEDGKETVNLPFGTYILREITAPEGYEKAADIEFTVNPDGTITIGGNAVDAITMVDAVIVPDSFDVTVLKTDDSTPAAPVKGAKLKIFDETGAEAGSWITGADGKNTVQLLAGVYTLREIEAPAGYLAAADITFEVKADGKIIVNGAEVREIVMIDKKIVTPGPEVEKIDVTIIKKNANGGLLIGARMQIKNPAGTILADWITDGTSKRFQLEAGNYILHEVYAPSGYLLASDIAFTVKPDRTVTDSTGAVLLNNTVTMIDLEEDDTPDVIVRKRDSITGFDIRGAVLALRDAKGNIVRKWVSDGKAIGINDLTYGTYELVELYAPAGYYLATPIKFTLDERTKGTIISMYDMPAFFSGGGDKDEDVSADMPAYETGTQESTESSPMNAVVMIPAAAAIAFTVRKRAKNK